jgi:hypothetical protein
MHSAIKELKIMFPGGLTSTKLRYTYIQEICLLARSTFWKNIAKIKASFDQVDTVTLKSNGDEVLNDEFLFKSNGDEAFTNVFS